MDIMLKTLHRPMIVTAFVLTFFAALSFAGIFLDDRTLLGVPIWLKPFKFFISLAIYNLTLAWLISLVRDRGVRIAWWLGVAIAIGSYVEMAVIAGQAVRGLRSHFNVSTPLDAALWTTMGSTIVMVWLATAWIGVLLLLQRRHEPSSQSRGGIADGMADRANALAIRFGLVIALFGLGSGFLMTSPKPGQIPSDGAPDFVGAHAVGVPDGGPGIPLVNWSADGGDLRVPHFVGMHALQALPLVAFGLLLLSRRYTWLVSAARRTRLVLAFAAFWSGLTLVVLWQALRGQSLIHPDGLTLTAFAAVIAASVAIALTALRLPANDGTAENGALVSGIGAGGSGAAGSESMAAVTGGVA